MVITVGAGSATTGLDVETVFGCVAGALAG